MKTQKLRIIEFLSTALSHDYIEINLSILDGIIHKMTIVGKNAAYINALSIYLHQLKIYNSPLKRRSISAIAINEIVHKPSTDNIEKSFSACKFRKYISRFF